MKKLVFVILSLFVVKAQATDFGWQVGVHRSTAEFENLNASEEPRINFRLGLTTKTEFSSAFYLRSGLTYTTRHTLHDSAGVLLRVRFEYLDVPVLAGFQITEEFSVYGGAIVGLNVAKKFELNPGPYGTMQDVSDLLVLGQVGANYMFQDDMGVDLFVEHSAMDMAGDAGGNQNVLKNFFSYGINLVKYF